MKNLIVITVKGDHKYSFGIDKSVEEILNEIETTNDSFYQVIPDCAIRVKEIVSVERFDINENGGAGK